MKIEIKKKELRSLVLFLCHKILYQASIALSSFMEKIILLSCISFLRMKIVMQRTHFNNLSFVISMRQNVNAKEQFGIFILRF